MYYAVFRNDKPGSNVWSSVIGEHAIRFITSAVSHAHYDKKADVLSVTMREGEPKHVVVGRGTFAIFADEEGIWQVDLEAESWDSDVDAVFPLMRVEMNKICVGGVEK